MAHQVEYDRHGRTTGYLGATSTWIDEHPQRALTLILVAGTTLQVLIAFRFLGSQFDIGSAFIVFTGLEKQPLHVYASLRWPYPPGMFPWIFLSGKLSASFHQFAGIFKLPSIAADAVLAAAVYGYLSRRGTSPRRSLVAASAIELGPLFILMSAYHGQIDAIAALSSTSALIVWQTGTKNRALLSGILSVWGRW